MKMWSFKKIVILFVGLLGLLLLISTVRAQSIVKLTLSGSNKHSTLSFTITENQPLKYSVFSLENPSRLVIDLKGVNQSVNLNNVDLTDSPVKKIRSARHDGGRLRIVLDLDRPVYYHSEISTLEGDHKQHLILTLSRSQQAASISKKKTVAATQSPAAVQATKTDAVKRSKNIIVMIDPGHGGKDPGATGVGGVHEKNVVLSISKMIVADINRQKGFEAYLTRSTDKFLTLRQRMEVARKHKADIFIAIHADAFSNKSAKGASVFALSTKGATSEAARWLAVQENQSELMGGVVLSDKNDMLRSVLINLSQTATIRSSLDLGRSILMSIKTVAPLHRGSVEQAAFVVLKSPDIPSLLIETGFLSNPSEAKRLASRAYQQKIADRIQQGLVDYFIAQPPRGTWLASANQLAREGGRQYRVMSGDTLSRIASRFSTSINDIKKTNRLTNDRLNVGQLLIIPKQTKG